MTFGFGDKHPPLKQTTTPLSRHRRKLVARRSQVRNQTQKVIDRGGVRIGAVLSDIFGRNGRRILDGLVARRPSTDILASLSAHVRGKLEQLGDALGLTLRETERRLLADLLSEHDTLSRRVDDFDRHLDEALAPWAEQLRLLETLPGIDHTAACAILSETGADPHRVFGNAHRLAAWAGLCPGNNESAGKRRTGRTRRGNQTLRTVLIECAHAAARTHNCQFQTYHQTLTRKRGFKRAIVATAHKLLRCVFAVLRDATPYRDPDTDYEALLVQRSASRWLRKLHQFDILVRNDDGTCSVHWQCSAAPRAGSASCISSTFSFATTTAPARSTGRLPQTGAPSRRAETAIPPAFTPSTVRAEATWGSLVRRASPGEERAQRRHPFVTPFVAPGDVRPKRQKLSRQETVRWRKRGIAAREVHASPHQRPLPRPLEAASSPCRQEQERPMAQIVARDRWRTSRMGGGRTDRAESCPRKRARRREFTESRSALDHGRLWSAGSAVRPSPRIQGSGRKAESVRRSLSESERQLHMECTTTIAPSP